MKEVKILVTGVGRRVELMRAFRQAALQLNINLKLIGADMAGTAPALVYCDGVRKVCSMKDPEYINQLVAICKKDKIDLVMPTIDTDLLVLSQNVGRFEEIGTRVLISKEDKVTICRDKNNTGAFFEKCGLKAPQTYNDYREYAGPYPCFIKPKDGSSSINAYKVENEEELEVYAGQVEDYIIQPFVSGREFTIDIFCDFEGNPIYIVPRERMQVRAGEVLKTRIHLDPVMIEESKKVIEGFNPCGPITVQLIQDEKTGENYYIEINPRYGGGAPLSIKAGADSPRALLSLLLGEKPGYVSEGISNNAVYSRFDDSVCIDEGDRSEKLKAVIFDLDDTLYGEKSYVRSGYEAVAKYVKDEQGLAEMWKYFTEGKAAIDEYAANHGLDNKSELLEIYRNHIPDISLYDGVRSLLDELTGKGIRVGIITDGRVEGQENKLKALGLTNIETIITDSLGGIQFRKPNDISFRILQNRWRVAFGEMIYVGDNPSKDFKAPGQLGMRSLYFKNQDGLYSHEDDGLTATAGSIREIADYLLSQI